MLPPSREKKEAVLEQSGSPIQADEAPKKGGKAGHSLFDLLEDGDAVSDEEGGGLMVCLLHVLDNGSPLPLANISLGHHYCQCC